MLALAAAGEGETDENCQKDLRYQIIDSPSFNIHEGRMHRSLAADIWEHLTARVYSVEKFVLARLALGLSWRKRQLHPKSLK